MRSLVTGATGYLGAALTKKLAEIHGADAVTALVRDPLPERERAASEELAALGVRSRPLDLMARPPLEVDGLEFDVVYHLAAETDSGASDEETAANSEGTRSLLRALGPLLRGKRIVLAGATAALDRCRRPRALLGEDDPPCPRTAYGRSKLAAERFVAELGDELGYRWVVPRFSPIWDPTLRSGFLAAFLEQVRSGSILRRAAWPGRVTMVRRGDAVEVLAFLGETGAGDGSAVNVGDGTICRYSELLSALRRIAGDESAPLPMQRPLLALLGRMIWLPGLRRAVPWRLSCLMGDDLAADTSRLRSLYDRPMRSFYDGLSEIEAAIPPPAESSRVG